MADLINVTSKVAPPQQSPQASPAEFGALTAGAEQKLGGQLERSGIIVKETQDRNLLWKTELNVAEAQVKEYERFEEAKRTAPPGAEGFTDQFKEQFAKYKEEMLAAAPNNQTKAYTARHLDASYERYLNESMEFEAKAQATQNANKLESTLTKYQNIVRADPTQLPNLEASMAQLIDNTPFWDNQIKDTVKREQTEALYGSALQGYVASVENGPNNANPKAVANAIAFISGENSPWIGKVAPETFNSALNSLEQTKKYAMAQSEKYNTEDFYENIRQIEGTGVDNGRWTPERIMTEVPDPKTRERMLEDLQIAQAVGKEMTWVKDASDSEIADRINEIKQNSITTTEYDKEVKIAKAFALAVEQRDAAIEADQVGFVIQTSPVAKAAQLELDTNPSPETMSKYAQTVIAEQQRLFPNRPVKLLNAGQIANVSEALANISVDEKGTDKALQVLGDIVQSYGKYSPMAIRDLQNADKLSSAQYVAANMLNDPMTKNVAKDLLRAAGLGTEKLNRSAPAGTRNKANKAMISVLAPFRNTVATWSDGAEIADAYQQAGVEYIMLKSLETGEDQSELANEFFKQTIGNKYVFEDTYRIPVNQPVAAIKGGVKTILPNIEQYDLVPLESIYDENIDLNRPKIQNPDGSFSTEKSITVEVAELNGEKPTNIPTIWDGKELSEKEAIKRAIESKQNFSSFNSIKEAVNAAKLRSKKIGELRGGNKTYENSNKTKENDITSLKNNGQIINLADGSGVRVVDSTGEPVMHYVDGKQVYLQFTWDELKNIDYKQGGKKRPLALDIEPLGPYFQSIPGGE